MHFNNLPSENSPGNNSEEKINKVQNIMIFKRNVGYKTYR